MKNNGISLISLIVTIIAIIIIASISIFSNLDTPDMANYSVFTEELKNIEVSLGILRSNNLAQYSDANRGFTKVKIENAPTKFMSFPDNGSDVIGYAIDLNKLDYKDLGMGEYEVTSDKVVFDKDDIFVYDKNGTVYYARGFEVNSKIQYNATTYREK